MKKKLKLQPEAEAEAEAEAPNLKEKKKKQKKPKPTAESEPAAPAEAKEKKRKRKSGGGGGGGDGRRKAALITDERFTSAQSDPRFQRMPKREPKVVVDSRFAHMLIDPKFAGSTAPVDKRGRPRKGDAVNPLLRYYLSQDDGAKDEDDEEEDEEDENGEEKVSSPGSDADVSSSSDDDDDDDDDDDQCSVNSDIAHYLMANHDDTPTIDHETHRLAIVNLDWGHIKAVDLYVVINSCLPKGGQLQSVAVYPSEFGLKCMEVESVHGPAALFGASSKRGEDGPKNGDEDTDKHREDSLEIGDEDTDNNSEDGAENNSEDSAENNSEDSAETEDEKTEGEETDKHREDSLEIGDEDTDNSQDGAENNSEDSSETEDEKTEGEETDDEELRTYELNKLRYYYAVVVCDSSATANHIYKTLDGTEFLSTSNVFDLRFIPDSMEFKHPPRDITTEAPTSYKEPDFHTRALQHSKVKLTWEEDEPDRKKILRRKFNPDQLDEFNDYLASTGESDSDDDENDKDSKKRIAREKLISLCQPEDDSDAARSDENDMEITFSTGLEDLSKRILEKKDKKSETVWEAVLRKKSEKKKAWKKGSKYSSDDSGDSDFQEPQKAPDQPDDFFADEEPIDDDDAKTNSRKTKVKSKKRDNKSRNGREPSPETNKEQEASRAELELLLADEQGADHRLKGYNLKTKKAKGKKGRDVAAENKLPDVDYKNDPRFSSLLVDPLYALDPTDPQYKRSATYIRQRSKKHETSSRGKVTVDEAGHISEQVDMQIDEVMPERDNNLQSGRDSSKEKYDFSSTIRSLKRNLVTMKKETKRT